MESDVGFYNKVKRALSQKDSAKQGMSSSSEEVRIQMPPQSPRGNKLKSDMSNSTLTTESASQQSSVDLASSQMFLVRDRSMDYGV